MSATATPESRVRRAARTVPVVRFTVKGQVRTDDDASPARAPAYGSPARAYTVVYDGACRICQGLVRRLGKWDRRGMLEIVPSQAPGVHATIRSPAADFSTCSFTSAVARGRSNTTAFRPA
jgi:hypothetical protein